MKKTSLPTTIKVYCRLRPLNRLEKEQGGECCVQFTDQAIKVKVAGNDTPYDFAFDGIFGPTSAQKDVFQKVAEPVITGLLEGYNGTIFAYGQTSSGKTFTMEGPDVIDSDEALGIIPRMMNYVFNLMMNSPEEIEFNVKVSFLELYNEKVQDLLDSRKNNLQIKEDKTKGIIVQDATEVYVTSSEEMKRVHKSGSENRTMAATRMNERSSRSHSIFVLSVDQKDTRTETTKHSKLYFVDLAGSEKISKTNVTGQQLEEAKNINKSLTALGIVINALTDKDKGHVPYRDSKLTRLLQESIGGNSQTSLILACSMCSYNDKETVDTLRFGSRAKSIKNAPIINAERSAKELTNLLTAAEKKILEQDNFIASLKAQISGSPLNNGMNKEIAQSNNENKKAEESVNSPDMSKKPAASSSGSSANSMFLLKNQIELANLKEELQEVKETNKELETEVSNKNKEIYELNGKILQYEAQIAEFANKNVNALEEYQVQFEKLYHENQERVMIASKFKRAIHRLKADLNFTYISKHLMAMDSHDNTLKTVQPDSAGSSADANKDELIVNSIKKTVEILEEIEKEIDENHKVTPNEDLSNILDGLMKVAPDSSTARTDSTSLFRAETLNDDAIKEAAWITEGSDDTPKDSDETPDMSKMENENEDELQKSQLQELSEDEKVNKLQSLIANQRKTINTLTKSNAELTHQNQKHLAAHEDTMQKYKSKAEEWQRLMKEKTAESNQKIYNIKSLLENKMREIEESSRSFERQLFDKDGRLSELREKNEKLQSLISGNEEAIRNYELENTLKVYVAERKRLAEDLMTLRKEVDEKDDTITEKTGQIEILQNNISLAAKEIKMLKQAKPIVSEIPPAGTCSCGGKTSQGSEKKNRALKAKNDFVLFDKHVVKPIRGGGGDATKFARNNTLTFEKPTRVEAQPEEKKSSSTKVSEPPKSSRSSFLNFNLGFTSSSNEEPKSTKAKDNANFKKFDDLMKQKSPGDSGKKAKPEESQRVHTDMDEVDEEESTETMKEKWKLLSGKTLATGQKKVGKLFTGVKNLFS